MIIDSQIIYSLIGLLLNIILIIIIFRYPSKNSPITGLLNTIFFTTIFTIIVKIFSLIFTHTEYLQLLYRAGEIAVMIFLFYLSILLFIEKHRIYKYLVYILILTFEIIILIWFLLKPSEMISNYTIGVFTIIFTMIVVWYYYLYRQKGALFLLGYLVLMAFSGISMLYYGWIYLIFSSAGYITLAIGIISLKKEIGEHILIGKKKRIFLRIGLRMIFTFGSLFGIVLVINTIVAYKQSEKYLRTSAQDKLQAVTQIKADNINNYLSDKKEIISNMAASQVLRDFLNNPQSASSIKNAQERIDRTKNSSEGVSEYSILDKYGKILMSTGSIPQNTDLSKFTVYAEALDGPYISDLYNSIYGNGLVISASAPIKDDISGETLGIVVMDYKFENFYKIVGSRSGLGLTGENYLINSNRFFITPSYYLGNEAVLKKQLQTKNTNDCFDPEEIKAIELKSNTKIHLHEATSEYIDYRNIKILGTHNYIPETGWCLIGEIDQQEIYSPSKQILWIFIFIDIVSIVLVMSAIYIASRRIVKPIEDLELGAKKIREGNLNYKFTVNSYDEIGELTTIFNEMIDAIKSSRTEIDNKVHEQTKDIVNKQKEIESQQQATLNILEDIESEKNKLTLEKNKINSIIQSIGDGLVVVDRNEKIILFNKQAENILNYDKIVLQNAQFSQVFKIQDRNNKEISRDKRPIIKALKNGEKIINARYYYQKKDNTAIPVAISTSPVKIRNQIIGAVNVFRDITKEEQIDKAKTEFVSLASHQLRTPLSAINWYAEMLASGDAGKLNKEQHKYLNEIYKGNQRMVELVNSLLNVSRLELGTFAVEPEPTNFIQTCKSVIKELIPQITKKKITIEEKYISNLPKIPADPKLLRIIFQNLLSNAVKYTQNKGKITVVIDKNSQNIIIKIADNGMGIPKSQQGQIFNKLFRANNVREKDTEGTGLGLYLVKSIIEHSGGKVWFESEENKGTTFFVEIPIMGMKKKTGSKGFEESIY